MTITHPSETEEQQTAIKWARSQGGRFKLAKLIFAIPNEGKRPIKTANRMKAEGMKAGIPDLFLPVAKGGYHGLWIEMKKIGGKGPTKTQRTWINALCAQGYRVEVCYGWHEATKVIMDYLIEPAPECDC